MHRTCFEMNIQNDQQFVRQNYTDYTSFSIYEPGLRLKLFSEMFHEMVTLHISWRRDFVVKTKVIAISPGLTTLNFGPKRRKINMVGLLLESERAVMVPSNIFENTSSGVLIKPCKTSVPTLQILCRLKTPTSQRYNRLFNRFFPKKFINIKV